MLPVQVMDAQEAVLRKERELIEARNRLAAIHKSRYEKSPEPEEYWLCCWIFFWESLFNWIIRNVKSACLKVICFQFRLLAATFVDWRAKPKVLALAFSEEAAENTTKWFSALSSRLVIFFLNIFQGNLSFACCLPKKIPEMEKCSTHLHVKT